MKIHSIGIDLGKTTFRLVALGERSKVIIQKRLSRKQLLAFTRGLQSPNGLTTEHESHRPSGRAGVLYATRRLILCVISFSARSQSSKSWPCSRPRCSYSSYARQRISSSRPAVGFVFHPRRKPDFAFVLAMGEHLLVKPVLQHLEARWRGHAGFTGELFGSRWAGIHIENLPKDCGAHYQKRVQLRHWQN